MHEAVIDQIQSFFCIRLNSPFSSLRTCSINRCEPVAYFVANPVTPERSSPTVIVQCAIGELVSEPRNYGLDNTLVVT